METAMQLVQLKRIIELASGNNRQQKSWRWISWQADTWQVFLKRGNID